MTKIFCDIADIKQIKKFNRKKIVRGFTTNPSLMRKAGAKDYSKYCKDILYITSKPISFEVFADDKKKIIKQALEIKNWGTQVFVKIPITNSKGLFLGQVIKYLNSKNISSDECLKVLNYGNIMEYPNLTLGKPFWIFIYEGKEYFIQNLKLQ